jgi:hypothetical protein
MKKWSCIACTLLLGTIAQATSLTAFHVDTAPNVYGSPDWAPWWATTQADVVAGTFDDMRSSVLNTPGDLLMDPYDEIVYSTGDLGQRLHWIYWFENTTVAELTGKVEVRWVIDWGGVDYTYDGGSWAVATAANGWGGPSSWTNYSGGVIGSLGFAWWSTDNDAPPSDTGGSPYDEVDQADIDALRNVVFDYQTFARGEIRCWDDTSGTWQTDTLQVNIAPVPEPTTISLMLLGMGGLALRRRRATA